MGYIRERTEELTGYQEGTAWSPEIDIQCDFVMVYRIDETTTERIRQFREKGYAVHLMAGSAWGKYQDYLNGEWDGRAHWDESQTDRNGNYILHGKDTPYMVPTIAFSDYLSEKLRVAVDAGVDAIHLEEPEFWDHGGYSEAFQREYELYYHEKWQPPHTSLDGHYKASRLKAYLYARALDRISASLKEYALTRYNRLLRFYVPTHSLLNYTQWKIMSPEAALTDIPSVDGYIAQIWTGTSRTPNVYEGTVRERTFETAFLEYGVMQELVKGTGRRMWFLHDPVEDWPEHTWEDFRCNYCKTVVASLLHPLIHTYEVCPWPTRVMNGVYPQRAGVKGGVVPDGKLPGAKPIPPKYQALLSGMTQLLGDMDQEEYSFEQEQPGIGILTADSGLFQRTYPDSFVPPVLADEMEGRLKQYAAESENSGESDQESQKYFAQIEKEEAEFLAFRSSGAYPEFFGLAMPLVKYGLLVRAVQLDNVRRFPGYLDDYKVLILSYELIKPMSLDCNTSLLSWIQAGGTLIYIGDGSDPYHRISAWWNTTKHIYDNPAEHLFEIAGLSRYPEEGIYHVGKGILAVKKEAPSRICLSKKHAEEYRDYIQQIFTECGINWNYANSMLLNRGPYRICAVMEESVSEEAKVLDGVFADMLDPEYPIITRKTIRPGENAILFDFLKIDSEQLRVIGTSARILALDCTGDKLCIRAKAAGGIRVHMRLRLPCSLRELEAVNESGEPVQTEWEWDERSRSVLISYDSKNEEVEMTAKLTQIPRQSVFEKGLNLLTE